MNKFPDGVDCRQPMTCHQRDQFIALTDEKRVGADEKCICPLSNDVCKDAFELCAGAYVVDTQLQSEGCCRRPDLMRLKIGIWIIGVDEESNRRCVRNKISHQFEPFCAECDRQKADTGDIAARSINAGDETQFDRIASDREYDGN